MALPKEEFIKKIREAGIVGAGGSGFPTYYKLKNQADYFIVNVSECEPLLKADQQLAFFFAENIIKTIDIIQIAVESKFTYIAIKKKYENAIEQLSQMIKKNSSSIKLFLLDDFYPSGDEHDLVYNITGRIVPEGGIPLDVGVLVDNVGTIINICNIIFNNEPVTTRWVTITGEVNYPRTLNLPLGTSLKDALKLCGGVTVSDYTLLDGGPMMGLIITDEDNYFITKTMTGLIVFPSNHGLIKRKQESIEESIKHSRSVCEQCSLCTEYCSRYILGHRDLKPHLMMRKMSYLSEYNLENYVEAYLCSECGLCSYFACPMMLSPKDIFVFLKKAMQKNNIKNPYLSSKRDVSESLSMYSYRRVPLDKLKLKIDVKQYDKPAELKLEEISIEKVKIPLSQHVGMKAVSVVLENQRIKKGDLIGDVPLDSLGARIHASITGTVTEVSDDYIVIEK